MILMLLLVAGLIAYKCSSGEEKPAERPPEPVEQVAALDVEHFLASIGEAGAPDVVGDQIEGLPEASAA